MDDALRRAWTTIVTPDDYEQHMLNIGQAQALAGLTECLIRRTQMAAGSSVVFAGAGTGQFLDFIGPDALRPYRVTFTDLNPNFLSRLQQRLDMRALTAAVIEDDLEDTKLQPAPDFLLAALVFEHIDWRRGVNVFASLKPATCALIIQENPPGMTTSVTPGRAVPPSIAKAMETAHANLVPRDQLVDEFDRHGYACISMAGVEVADAKRLLALRFSRAVRT